ncbi:MAG: acylphosphatase [Candidatus Tectomicrobia bacterium]|uniref:acylphosphatase n=1 Tax=Tectimicrobiota bacterium TaxID=2528274 RepID=A0A933GL52_UNCTE|nr:acylphosphatase [Candidatus Tectomicrobia bacterium]
MKAQASLLIMGRVQGVFFRANAQQIARKFSIKGWVRNLEDGNLEILAEGEEENLQSFINWCHKGPKGAIVKKVDISWREYDGKFTDFNILF